MNLPFRPVSKRKNELQQDESQVEILEYSVDNGGYGIAKGKTPPAVGDVRPTTDKVHDDASR